MGSSDKFPYEIEAVEEELIKKYSELEGRYVFVGPKKYFLPKIYKAVANTLYNFEARPDDVWIYGFARSGTTLTQEIVWLLSNNLDYQKAAESIMDLRFPVFEGNIYFNKDHNRLTKQLGTYNGKTQDIAEKWSRPAWETLTEIKGKRFIKTHLPFSLGPTSVLTSGCKVLYLARNPKDVCVSSYHLYNNINHLQPAQNFEKFWNYFRDGLIYSAPYFAHLKEGWEARNNNILFLLYEDTIKDIRKTIRTIAEFLGKEITDNDVEKLAEHVKIDNFRKNQSVNNEHLKKLGVMTGGEDSFIRKGGSGGWRDYFKEDIDVEANQWIEENLKNSDLKLF